MLINSKRACDHKTLSSTRSNLTEETLTCKLPSYYKEQKQNLNSTVSHNHKTKQKQLQQWGTERFRRSNTAHVTWTWCLAAQCLASQPTTSAFASDVSTYCVYYTIHCVGVCLRSSSLWHLLKSVRMSRETWHRFVGRLTPCPLLCGWPSLRSF